MTALALVSSLIAAGAAREAGAQQTSASSGTQLPPLNFSGVLMANYQHPAQPDASGTFDKFDLERVYLTFQMPAGDRASIRATADVFQQTNAANATYYTGWAVRMKYAYLQYDYLKGANWSAFARFGLLHTVQIDHEEQFWPRWISQTDLERAGYFSSADAGVATQITLPNKLGQVYATITNGPGYASRELDRFKDYSARVTLTPLANSTTAPALVRTFDVSPWIYRGTVASSIAGVGSGMARDRWGIFAGIRDPRLTAGVQYAQATTGSDTGTPATRTVADSTGSLLSGFVWSRPFSGTTSRLRPLGVVVRYDDVHPRANAAQNGQIAADYHLFIGGLTWDLTSHVALSADYQEQLPNASGIAPSRSKSWFFHVVASF